MQLIRASQDHRGPLRTRPPRRTRPRGREEAWPDPLMAAAKHKVYWPRQALLHHGVAVGFDYVHSRGDDHSRLAYSEIHPDEKVATCAGSLNPRRRSSSTAQGITRIERVLTDNAWAYRKGLAWKSASSGTSSAPPGNCHPTRRPPQKDQRQGRTLQPHPPRTEWGLTCGPTPPTTKRTAALAPWLEHYNTERRHSAHSEANPRSAGIADWRHARYRRGVDRRSHDHDMGVEDPRGVDPRRSRWAGPREPSTRSRRSSP